MRAVWLYPYLNMFKASSGVFQALQSDLKTSISSLQRTNQWVNLYSTALVLALQVLAAGLPWYSHSLLKDSSWNYVLLYGVCRGDWNDYCRLYESLVEDCEGEECGEFDENWKAGRLALGLVAVAAAGLLAAIVNALFLLKWPNCCSAQLTLQASSLLCCTAGTAVWLGWSRYERASSTEVQPGMTLALVASVMNTALVLHTAMTNRSRKEFQASL